jgi:hypothetical protein
MTGKGGLGVGFHERPRRKPLVGRLGSGDWVPSGWGRAMTVGGERVEEAPSSRATPQRPRGLPEFVTTSAFVTAARAPRSARYIDVGNDGWPKGEPACSMMAREFKEGGTPGARAVAVLPLDTVGVVGALAAGSAGRGMKGRSGARRGRRGTARLRQSPAPASRRLGASGHFMAVAISDVDRNWHLTWVRGNVLKGLTFSSIDPGSRSRAPPSIAITRRGGGP